MEVSFARLIGIRRKCEMKPNWIDKALNTVAAWGLQRNGLEDA